MPRNLAIGNGRLLVTFDATYTMRDFYYPHVGRENHTIGVPCRMGVWVEGQFAWLTDSGWVREIRYRPDSLVSDVTLEHAGMRLQIHATDAVHPERTILLRSFQVTNLAEHLREVRLFFHQDFHISENEIGDTATYEPVNHVVGHYKGRRYFVINGRTGDGEGIFQYATGFKDSRNGNGTWRDAEDGWLEMNPIAQGAVDSTVSLRQNISAGETRPFHFWIGVEKDYWEARSLNMYMLGGVRRQSAADVEGERLAAHEFIAETDAHWQQWISRAPDKMADLPGPVRELFRRSLLMIATQIDHDGAIIAANDGDSMQFNRDTYSYMWPRDGALVARTLDRCGYSEITEQFFRFCSRLMPRTGYYPDGYLMHKFHADGSLGSSWHPWVRDGRPSLPIQEDETALVLWALWHHVESRRASDPKVFDLMRDLAATLIVPAARFLLIYRDEISGRERFNVNPPHAPTGLPLASYDLWEERYGIHAFTVVSICGGLTACSNLLALILNQQWMQSSSWMAGSLIDRDGTPDPARLKRELAELAQRCDAAAAHMKAAFKTHFWSAERQSYGRMLQLGPPHDLQLDSTLDASTLYSLVAFGVFEPHETGLRETIEAIERRLWCKTAIGGMARYENDYYHRQSNDIENVPGNPWYICTLWAALGGIFLAQNRDDLSRPLEIILWASRHARPSGVLAEQVHPHTGEPMSVAPLTWSHSTLVETVLAYADKFAAVS